MARRKRSTRRSLSGLVDHVPAVMGSPWYTLALAGAAYWYFFKKPAAPRVVTKIVEVGTIQADAVRPIASPEQVQAVTDSLNAQATTDMGLGKNTGIVPPRNTSMAGYGRNPYLVN